MNLVKHVRELLAFQKEGAVGLVVYIYAFRIRRARACRIRSVKPPGEGEEEEEEEKGGEEEGEEGEEEERERKSWGKHFHIYMPTFKGCKEVSSVWRGFWTERAWNWKRTLTQFWQGKRPERGQTVGLFEVTDVIWRNILKIYVPGQQNLKWILQRNSVPPNKLLLSLPKIRKKKNPTINHCHGFC